jgi:flavin-binding protein dodecin
MADLLKVVEEAKVENEKIVRYRINAKISFVVE